MPSGSREKHSQKKDGDSTFLVWQVYGVDVIDEAVGGEEAGDDRREITRLGSALASRSAPRREPGSGAC